jgi:hypothetical protein
LVAWALFQLANPNNGTAHECKSFCLRRRKHILVHCVEHGRIDILLGDLAHRGLACGVCHEQAQADECGGENEEDALVPPDEIPSPSSVSWPAG